MKLYEIEQAIMDCVDMETGEIIDADKLAELELERDIKIENVALYIKNLSAEAEAYKAEKLSFAEKQKVAENKVDSLKRFLSKYLNGEKYKSAKVMISFRKSESVNILDMSKLPDDYLKFKDPEADKTLIKQSIKKGIAIPGAELVESQNIQIK